MSAGHLHTVAIKTDGVLWAWGSNAYGQIGQDLSFSYKYYPDIVVNSGNNNQFITSGAYHNGIVKSDGTLFTWGYNINGQLGDGTTTNSIVSPTKISCAALAIEKILLNNNSFSIYPNPVKDILYIQNTNNQNIDKIVITDLTGKNVLEQKGNNKQMNIQQLQQGMYLLKVFSGGKSSQSKFMKQ